MKWILVYGKPACVRCNKFKEKLKLLGVPYKSIDVSDLQNMWRENEWEAREAMSALSFCDDILPAIDIGGTIFGYSDGMKYIKKCLKDRVTFIEYKKEEANGIQRGIRD